MTEQIEFDVLSRTARVRVAPGLPVRGVDQAGVERTVTAEGIEFVERSSGTVVAIVRSVADEPVWVLVTRLDGSQPVVPYPQAPEWVARLWRRVTLALQNSGKMTRGE